MTATTLRRQRRRYRDREVLFVPWRDGSPVYAVIEWAARARADVVYLCGPSFGVEMLRGMVASDPPAGWSAESHYLSLPNPVLRYAHLDGRRVEIHRAASFFGEGDYAPELAAASWKTLAALVRGNFDEGRVLTTPASTGRYLLTRSISGDREWPVLDTATQDFIRATSGQGRVEMFGREGRGALFQYDGRLAYAALCSQLPAGEPTFDTIRNYAGWHVPGRYKVSWRVPHDWEERCECGAPGHRGIGLLPFHDGDQWRWPSEPDDVFGPSWVDGREVGIALTHGWAVQIHERLMFPTPPYPAAMRRNKQPTRRGPLDAWSEKLSRLRYQTRDPLVHVALRSIILFGIGALHGAPRKITHTVSRADALAGKIPDHAANVMPLGDGFVWTETEAARWPEMSHPEWSTAIWARARVALLDCAQANTKERAGMLHVPADDVVACFTDSLYLTHDPRWTDDGRVGRLRRVWADEATRPLPTTATALRRRKAEL